MIKETVAALAGVVSGLTAFSIVFFYQVASNPTLTNTRIIGSQPIAGPAGPIFGQANPSLNFLGVSGILSGVFPAMVLVVLAVGAGIVVSQLGRAKLRGDVET